MVKGIVDRVEGDYVLIEIDGVIKEFSSQQTPSEVKEGDVVHVEGQKITLDKKATALLRKKVKNLMNEIWQD